MKIGVLGTGMVGSRIGGKLLELGHEVMMGSRTAGNQAAADWAKNHGGKASHGTFENAAAFGEILFLCVKGDSVLNAISLSLVKNFNGKTVIDITNPLDFSRGMPPSLFISNSNSLGEEVQNAIPLAHIVKTLNMVSNEIMVDPRKSGGDPTMFLCGNDRDAKDEAVKLLKQFGWSDIIDLGDISNARGTEMLLPIWLRIWNVLQDGNFAFKVIRNK